MTRERGDRREEYHQQFPTGFKRKRNAEQREKQRVSQRRYAKRRQQARGLIRRALRLANGKGNASKCKELVGCTREEFVQHLRQYTDGTIALRFFIPVSRYNLDDHEQLQEAFHYRNIYAVERGDAPRRIPLTIESARRMAGVWV